MTHEMTCIICPNGCELRAAEENGSITVTGAACPKGTAYGEAEVRDPRRTLTTTLRVRNGSLPLVSVRSESPVRKADLLTCMQRLKGVRVGAPVRIGELLFEDTELGLRLLATKNVAESSSEPPVC